MDTALPQNFPFILDWNLAKANCTGNRVCTFCDIVVLGQTKSLSVMTGNDASHVFLYVVFPPSQSNRINSSPGHSKSMMHLVPFFHQSMPVI